MREPWDVQYPESRHATTYDMAAARRRCRNAGAYRRSDVAAAAVRAHAVLAAFRGRLHGYAPAPVYYHGQGLLEAVPTDDAQDLPIVECSACGLMVRRYNVHGLLERTAFDTWLCPSCASRPVGRHIPADVKARLLPLVLGATQLTVRELSRRYGIGLATIHRWRCDSVGAWYAMASAAPNAPRRRYTVTHQVIAPLVQELRHIYPLSGPKHSINIDGRCWCGPVISNRDDLDTGNANAPVYVHRLAQDGA